MIASINIYEDNKEYEDIELDIDFRTFYDGIGSYEYWGAKCYDKGQLCCEITNIKLIRHKDYSDDDVEYIEKYIKENGEKIDETIERQIWVFLENEKESRDEERAEDRYYRNKYGD